MKCRFPLRHSTLSQNFNQTGIVKCLESSLHFCIQTVSFHWNSAPYGQCRWCHASSNPSRARSDHWVTGGQLGSSITSSHHTVDSLGWYPCGGTGQCSYSISLFAAGRLSDWIKWWRRDSTLSSGPLFRPKNCIIPWPIIHSLTINRAVISDSRWRGN